MKTIKTGQIMPDFDNEKFLAHFDIKILDTQRMMAKVILVETQADLIEFRERHKFPFSDRTCCFCWSCEEVYKSESARRKDYSVYDKDYFSMLVFCLEHLNLMHISHECVHAAMFHNIRNPRLAYKWWSKEALDSGEHLLDDMLTHEAIAYPTGIMVGKISHYFAERGYLYF
jgi:hypothetical protein